MKKSFKLRFKSNTRKRTYNKKSTYTVISLLLCCACIIGVIGYKSNQSNVTATSEKTANAATTASGSAISSSSEMRGVWISFLSYKSTGYTKAQFTKHVRTMFNKCVSKNYNTVFVHVRMFADAMYDSKYFPWSTYASGKIGSDPGYDPLSIMVTEAHKRGLAIHAWINPYRITSGTTSVSSLSKSSYAYKWAKSSSASKRRNVLSYGGQLYFNPASADVRKLITNGVKEIVKNYNVDGIHFDDYFYPNLGTSYRKVFDNKEYNSYAKACKKAGTTPLGIVKWRRRNVNMLVKKVHTAVKSIDSKCKFGISPAGNIDNLYLDYSYYCDVKKWMKSSDYIDYICPQIYWSFTQSVCPYKKTCKRWTDLPRNKSVKLYIGLAAYRAGLTTKEAKAIGDIGWSKSNTILKRQVQYARNTGQVSGFIAFSYEDLTRKAATKEINNLKKVFK